MLADLDHPSLPHPKRKKVNDTNNPMGFGVKNRSHLLEMFEYHKEQNLLHRKPCSACGNLVRPELIETHFEAYHPNHEGTPSVVTEVAN